MKTCPLCGYINQDNAAFCLNCKTALSGPLPNHNPSSFAREQAELAAQQKKFQRTVITILISIVVAMAILYLLLLLAVSTAPKRATSLVSNYIESNVVGVEAIYPSISHSPVDRYGYIVYGTVVINGESFVFSADVNLNSTYGTLILGKISSVTINYREIYRKP